MVFQGESHTGLVLEEMSPREEMAFIQCTFARADAWIDSWGRKRPDAPGMAAGQILRIGLLGFHNVMFHLSREMRRLLRRPEPGASAN